MPGKLAAHGGQGHPDCLRRRQLRARCYRRVDVSGLLMFHCGPVRTALAATSQAGCGQTGGHRASKWLFSVHFSEAVCSSLFRLLKEAPTGGAWKTPQAAWMRGWPPLLLLETWKKNRKPRPWEAGCKWLPEIPHWDARRSDGPWSRAVGDLEIPYAVLPLIALFLSEGDPDLFRVTVINSELLWHCLEEV